MTLDQFLKMLDLYGADLTRWPAAKRAAAADLVSRSAEARRALDEAGEFDRLLDLVDDPVRPDQIERSLAGALARIGRPAPRRTFAAALAFWAPRATALAAAAVVGFVVGSAVLDWRDRSGLGQAGVSAFIQPIFVFPS